MVKEFEYKGKAMGTDFSVAIVCGSKEIADTMYKVAKADIEEYEAIFSRFLATSELSILNESKDMIVSETFFQATVKSYQLFVKTRGIFNPLVSIARFGYNKNFLDIEDNKNIEDKSPYNIDFSSVIIDHKTHRICLKEGQMLDYGGFLKGYLSEIIAKKIKLYSKNITGVIVNIGGDIYTEGLDEKGNEFTFNIYNPFLEGEDILVTLHNQSLVTSGTYKRSWLRFGERMHHILDVSGKKNPESRVVSASVIYKDGAMAEAYAKVFLSMSHEDALGLLVDRNISFVIIKDNMQVIKSIQ